MENKFISYKIGRKLEFVDSGDILLVGTNTFLSKAIKFFQKNKYSHAGIFIWIYDELFVCESDKRGIALTKAEDYFNNNKYDLKILKPKFDIDEKKLAKIMLPHCGKTPYDFVSLLIYEPIRFIFGKWIGGNAKNSANRFMCGEWCAYVINTLKPDIYNNWFKIAPVDIEKDTENFEVIYVNKI
jgi:hypothetical protein